MFLLCSLQRNNSHSGKWCESFMDCMYPHWENCKGNIDLSFLIPIPFYINWDWIYCIIKVQNCMISVDGRICIYDIWVQEWRYMYIHPYMCALKILTMRKSQFLKKKLGREMKKKQTRWRQWREIISLLLPRNSPKDNLNSKKSLLFHYFSLWFRQ